MVPALAAPAAMMSLVEYLLLPGACFATSQVSHLIPQSCHFSYCELHLSHGEREPEMKSFAQWSWLTNWDDPWGTSGDLQGFCRALFTWVQIGPLGCLQEPHPSPLLKASWRELKGQVCKAIGSISVLYIKILHLKSGFMHTLKKDANVCDCTCLGTGLLWDFSGGHDPKKGSELSPTYSPGTGFKL